MTDYELLSPWVQMHTDPPTLFVRKWVQTGEGGSGGPPSENSEFGKCDFLYSGAFLGWPAEEGQYLNSFRFIAFCFLTSWGSDFTQRLGFQGPLTLWVIQAHSVIHPYFIYAHKVSSLCAWLKCWPTQQLWAGMLFMKSESSCLRLFIHLCHSLMYLI